MNPEIWTSTLDGITKLEIIAKQPDPVEARSVMATWRDILKPILEYLAQAIPESTNILVNTDEESVTVQVMEEFLPKRFRFLHLEAWDLIFRRRQYSEESGYWDSDDQ
jgi:hypothetical protein